MENPEEAPLVGTRWLVEDIGGQGVIDNAQSTVEFPETGHVAGNTCINRYSGPVSITGNKIRLGELVMTRRAGPPALMDQEQKLMKALKRVRLLDRPSSGLLYLLDAHDKRLLKMSPMKPLNDLNEGTETP